MNEASFYEAKLNTKQWYIKTDYIFPVNTSSFQQQLDGCLNVALIPQTTISRPSAENHLTSDKQTPVLFPASRWALQKPSMPFFSVCQIPEEV